MMNLVVAPHSYDSSLDFGPDDMCVFIGTEDLMDILLQTYLKMGEFDEITRNEIQRILHCITSKYKYKVDNNKNF